LAAASLFGDSPTTRDFNPLYLDFSSLFSEALTGVPTDQRRFYAAKIRRHPDSLSRSDKLIEEQRALKTKLELSGFEVVIAGSVRGNYVTSGKGKPTLIFREKGVDVRLAVDTVAEACDGNLKTAIICSSDSDVQPAIAQLKKRGISVIYVGFESSQNKGLTYTCDRTILLRNAELAKWYKTPRKSVRPEPNKH
jgi:uncharacterized LabA/DUF88 family protein